MSDLHDALAQAYARIAPDLARRRAKRAELRQSGWSALRVARRLGYDIERESESGYYLLWSPRGVDVAALLALGWTWSEGPMMWLEGR